MEDWVGIVLGGEENVYIPFLSILNVDLLASTTFPISYQQ